MTPVTPQFLHATLSNGLQVVAEILPGALTTALGLFVRVGSRDETKAQAGISHFIEHMVFKGTENRSGRDVNRELDELGGQGNAYTGEEQTCYHTTVLPRYQDRAVRLLCDFLRPAFREEDLESERSVILEEIAKYDDQPPFGAGERLQELYFGTHPLSGRILGTKDSVNRLNIQHLRTYFHTQYAPGNLVFSAAGAVDFDKLVSTLEAETNNGSPKRERVERIRFSPTPTPRKEKKIVASSASAYVLRSGPAPRADDPQRFAARLATSMLGDEAGSRLFWALIDNGRAEAASAWLHEYDDCGTFNLFLACDPKEVRSCLKIMDREIDKLVSKSVVEAELRQAISRSTASAILASERPGFRMFAIGENWVSRGRYDSLDEVVQNYRNVSRDQIRAYLQEYRLETLVEVTVGPQ
jgi:predicted Zn-dependent peptidase